MWSSSGAATAGVIRTVSQLVPRLPRVSRRPTLGVRAPGGGTEVTAVEVVVGHVRRTQRERAENPLSAFRPLFFLKLALAQVAAEAFPRSPGDVRAGRKQHS